MPRTSLSGWRARGAIGVGIAWIALLLAGHDRPAEPLERPAPAPAATVDPSAVADLLPGTWLREQDEPGVRARRLLRLEAGGTFHERVRLVAADGAVTQLEHAGTWLYDGTNLKRKYTLMNGRPPSRLNLPFATFEIRFETRNAFTGVDHIHRNTVRYVRVGDDAQP